MIDSKRLTAAVRHLTRLPEVIQCFSSMEHAWSVVSSYVGISRVDFPYEARFFDGTRYSLLEFYDLETLWQIYFHNVYEVRPSDRCIVDAGANIGLFACYAARKSPECSIYAIEPFPATYGRLVSHVAANKASDRVHCFPLALSASAGAVAMASGAPSQMLFIDNDAALTDKSTVMVQAETLPAFLGRLPEKTIDLLKMDIEGSEYEVLLNTPPQYFASVSRLAVEYHQPRTPVPYGPPDLVQHLAASGLRLTRQTGLDGYGILSFRPGCELNLVSNAPPLNSSLSQSPEASRRSSISVTSGGQL